MLVFTERGIQFTNRHMLLTDIDTLRTCKDIRVGDEIILRKTNVFKKFLTCLSSFSVNINVAVDVSMNNNSVVCGKLPCGKGSYHIETSQLIYSADQLTGLCMVRIFEKVIFK